MICKPILLDLGAHKGKFASEFMSKNPKHSVLAFEPNPEFKKVLSEIQTNNDKFQYLPYAAWVSGGEMEFFICKVGNKGSTLVDGKTSHDVDYANPVMVQSIDISAWVLKNISYCKGNVIKIDIEGAEYEVIPKMIRDGSIKIFDTIMVEFHIHKFENDSITKDLHDKILRDLSASGINVVLR